ncbi:MAG: hypothetical protein K0U78_19505 [Actinomycetia bacterium]|nr:hypothetical protein [Actinomycetes bacterium]
MRFAARTRGTAGKGGGVATGFRVVGAFEVLPRLAGSALDRSGLPFCTETIRAHSERIGRTSGGQIAHVCREALVGTDFRDPIVI